MKTTETMISDVPEKTQRRQFQQQGYYDAVRVQYTSCDTHHSPQESSLYLEEPSLHTAIPHFSGNPADHHFSSPLDQQAPMPMDSVSSTDGVSLADQYPDGLEEGERVLDIQVRQREWVNPPDGEYGVGRIDQKGVLSSMSTYPDIKKLNTRTKKVNMDRLNEEKDPKTHKSLHASRANFASVYGGMVDLNGNQGQ